MNYLNITKIGLKSWEVLSTEINKHKEIVKQTKYLVDKTNLDNFSCNCIFMQKYNFDFNKFCKHINAVKQLELKQINKVNEILKCNLADKPIEYDYING